MDVNIDIEKEAKKLYDAKMDEWYSYGPFYRLKHRKEKPTMNAAFAEARRNAELQESGRGM